MNKLYTLEFKENERHLNPEITDRELMEKSEQGMKIAEQPSQKVINFLLNYSKSLEAKNGYTYQLN